MIARKSDGADRANGKRDNAQACLLRNERGTVRTDSRVTHEAHGGRCVLTQSRPGTLRTRETPLRTTPALAGGKTGMPPISSVYETSARITGVDRAIIRAYFQTHDASARARRRKSEGYAKRAVGPRDRDAGLLPEELERKLTPLPAGYYRMLRGGSVILVDEGTHEVIDAVRGVAVA